MTNSDVLRFIRCRVAGETYGLDMMWVRSIQRMDQLRRNPEAEGPVGWVAANVGDDIPVFGLANQLGRVSDQEVAGQRIVVLNDPSRPWAMLVDRVSQVIQVPAGRVVPLPAVVVNPALNYFQGVIRLGDELLLRLAPERLHPDAPVNDLRAETQLPPEKPPSAAISPPPTGKLANWHNGRQGQIVIFSLPGLQIGEQNLVFGLSISQVTEALEPLPLVPVPAAPAFVSGLVNWRDRPVPVIDLGRRLGMAAEAAPVNGQTRLMIARAANQDALIGFLVESDIQVLRLPLRHQPCQQPLPLDQTLTRGSVELGDKTLVIPDIGGLHRRNYEL